MDRPRVEARMKQKGIIVTETGAPDWDRLAAESDTSRESMRNWRTKTVPGRLVRASIARVLDMTPEEIWPKWAARMRGEQSGDRSGNDFES